MTPKFISQEKKKGYVILTLDKPPGNTLSIAVLRELQDILTEVEGDKEIRAVLLTGAGYEVFSSGIDMMELHNVFGPKDEEKLLSWIELGMDVCNKIESFPKPFVIAINGLCLGGGLELAICGHILLIADDALMGMPMLGFGIIPVWGGGVRLLNLAGRQKALEMLLDGEPISAQEAKEVGLVSRIVPKEKLQTEAVLLTERLSKGSPAAMAGIIEEFGRSRGLAWDEVMNLEKQIGKKVCRSEDAGVGYREWLKQIRGISKKKGNFKEGVLEFWKKLEPDFPGV